MDVNGISTDVTSEVFDSRGKWDFLFSKTLLKNFKATHNYGTDTIAIQGAGGETILHNQEHITSMQSQPQQIPATPVCVVTEEAQEDNKNLPKVDMEVFKNNTDIYT